MICRYDNSGLGNLSWELARHLRPRKVLLVENHRFQKFPERYADFETRIVGRTVTPEDRSWLLDGTDVILSCETFYDWSVVPQAKSLGVRTVLMPMFEMSPANGFQYQPDGLLCPSTLDYRVLSGNKEYLPVPVATDVLGWKGRQRAETFVHIASHGGMNGRKGTGIVLDAVRLAKSDFRMIIYTWNEVECDDPRVEVRRLNFKNYWQLWREGDVLVYPQDYNGICLPVLEAFASGMAVMTTDIEPFNEWLPREALIPKRGMRRLRAAGSLMEVDAAIISPEDVAAKIDAMAGTDISAFSEAGRKHAEENSWDALLPRYNDYFKRICER